ncbi:hypothetical protein KIW84_021828 [Lathyrus oleraceus]|uniref:NB-ARC domain-containing protein n=1 Tax=Pisum sativum TaxID=3888 RepID=A0A9D4Y9L7_PEA|nr:hypothetical protein KIW84_021828 [Pisum sativum]
MRFFFSLIQSATARFFSLLEVCCCNRSIVLCTATAEHENHPILSPSASVRPSSQLQPCLNQTIQNTVPPIPINLPPIPKDPLILGIPANLRTPRFEVPNRSFIPHLPLKSITERFDKIAEARNKFLLREDDQDKIVEFLLTQARDSHSLSIYPIIGLGGVGKTTLAQLVYNDIRVRNNFNTKISVCVSKTFSVKRILCSIIDSIKSEKCDSLDLDVLQIKVQSLLQGKIYFLVLDDVWNKTQELESGLSQEKWNKLKSVFLCGSRGSSILVSTRDEDVAEIVRTCQTYHLSGLPENECWLLFKQYAFGHDKEERAELVAIGKEIMKKCGGLPLVAQALGGLMRSRSGEKEWLEVKESRIWALTHENSILPALRLSYFHLTPILK